jgi:translocation and assembly module TamB
MAWRGHHEERRPGDGAAAPETSPANLSVSPGGAPAPLNWRRGILVGAALLSCLILVAIIAALVFTGTEWGRERIRRYAQSSLNGMIHGRATIGRISGNLLTGMTVHDFAITDSAGQPFVAVESFSARYAVLSFLRKRIWLTDAVLVHPLIVLNRMPGQKWNWQNIFLRDTVAKPASQAPGWGDWILFTNAKVVGGQLIVRTPWNPSEHLTPAGRDSVIRQALGGGTRLLVNRVPGGFQKTVQLDSVNATLPLVRLADPSYAYRLAQVRSLSMVAYPFRPPAAVVRDLVGAFRFNNDSLWWKGAIVRLPNSTAMGDGSYALSSGDMTLTVHSDPASFADMRWVYPRLPANGHGSLDLALKWRGAAQDYTFTNTDIAIGDARLSGAFGITLTDTIALHDTDVRFRQVDTRLVEQMIPGFQSPFRGVAAGHAVLSGGRHAMAVNGDVTFDAQQYGHNVLVANGGVGFLDGGGLRANDLHLRFEPLQVAMARKWYPSLPIGGQLTGAATLNGSTVTRLTAVANVDHVDRGAHSALDGTVQVAMAGGKWFDVNLTARPISLLEVGRFFPSAGLRGSATGPVRLTGALRNLRVATNLALPDGGRFDVHGSLDLASRAKGYDLTASLYTLNLRTIDSKAPVTSLTANARVSGRGTQLATMDATVSADLSTSRWDSIAVDTVSVRLRLANGLADVRHLYAHGAHTTATASGSFGLARGSSGTLTYNVATDSLGAFNRWLPRSKGAAAAVEPRPGVTAAAIRRAREDSARVAKATEMERMITGRAGPGLVVHAPEPVPVDMISGRLAAAGTVRGNLYDFDLRGRAAGEQIVARGNFIGKFRSEYAWTNARTPQAKLAVGVDADSVSAMGFAFDTASARVTYSPSGGHVELLVTQDQSRQYSARGDYALYPDRRELRLADMTFRFDTTYWSMPHQSLVTWGGPGVRVDDFELRNRGRGRLYANGLLPTSGVANFTLDIDEFPVSNVSDILQSDVDVTGVFSLHGAMTGTTRDPAFHGAFGVVHATYNGTPVPELLGTFGYADRSLVSHLDAVRANGKPMTTVDAKLPVDLALSGVGGSRVLNAPMTVDIVGDSLPIDLLPYVTDVVSNVHGHAAARVAVRGTLTHPIFVGGMTLRNGVTTINATGATIQNIAADLRMASDTIYIDSIAGQAGGPVHVRGSLAMGDNWREPAFNLYLVSSGAELLNNDRGTLDIDAGIALKGPFRNAYLSGAATVVRGVIYAPEPTGRHAIGAGDPALFNVLDTAVTEDQILFVPQSPLLANLRMELSVDVRHNTWVRNNEANVEIYTDQPVIVRQQAQTLTLTGVVTTERGEYRFMSKRFQIARGSAMFIGSPDLNPTLQVTGAYQVAVPGHAAIDIKVIIGGTLRRPRLSLESDAQPPKTQSELLSLLAFGQSTTSLLAFTSSSIAGSAATMDLFGVGAQVAMRRLAGVALGVAVQQVEIQAGRAFNTDYFDITPGDVPTEIGAGPGSTIGNFFTQTKFEAGKYINPRTFVSGQEQAGQLGAAIEHRTADGWRFNASVAPRILLSEPRLNAQPYRTVRAYGGFIVKEWRF